MGKTYKQHKDNDYENNSKGYNKSVKDMKKKAKEAKKAQKAQEELESDNSLE